MNGISRDVLQALQDCPAPSLETHAGGERGSMTCNQFGTMVMMDDMHGLQWCDIRGTIRQKCQRMVISKDGNNAFEDQLFTNIAFNPTGNLILCWGSKSVGVVYIPQSFMRDGALVSQHNGGRSAQSELFFSLLLQHDSGAGVGAGVGGVSVLQAAFHPLSPAHAVVLQSDNKLLLIDVLRKTSEEHKLQDSYYGESPEYMYPADYSSASAGSDKFVRFCFGGNYYWMYFTVFLVTQRGSVYCLCPVIPTGAILPTALREELLAWVREEPAVGQHGYREALQGYLSEIFEGGRKDNSFRARREPFLQGPFVTRRAARTSTGAGAGGGTSIDTGGGGGGGGDRERADDGGLRRHKRTSNVCDVCCPQSAQRNVREAPVIAIAYDDGWVDLLVHDPEASHGSCFICPLWATKEPQAQIKLRKAMLPAMLLVEEINIGTSSAAAAGGGGGGPVLRLTPDPVYSYMLHLSDYRTSGSSGSASGSGSGMAGAGAGSGGTCFLSIAWLKDLLLQTRNAEEKQLWDDVEFRELAPTSLVQVVCTERPLGGMVIVSDAMLGHLVVARTVSDKAAHPNTAEVHIRNITVVKRMYEYANAYKAGIGAGQGSSNRIDTGTFEHKAKELLAVVESELNSEALRKYCESKEEISEDAPDPKFKALLQEASGLLKSKVIALIESLAFRIVSTLDNARSLFEDQKKVLEDKQGMKASLLDIRKGFENKEQRVQRIGQRLLAQRSRVKGLVEQYSAICDSKEDDAAYKAFSKEMLVWRNRFQQCLKGMEELDKNVKIAKGELWRSGDELIHAGSLAAMGIESVSTPLHAAPGGSELKAAVSGTPFKTGGGGEGASAAAAAGAVHTPIPNPAPSPAGSRVAPSTGGKRALEGRRNKGGVMGSAVKFGTPAAPSTNYGPLELPEETLAKLFELERERAEQIKLVEADVEKLSQTLQRLTAK